jgi:hypothetical protein
MALATGLWNPTTPWTRPLKGHDFTRPESQSEQKMIVILSDPERSEWGVESLP